MNTKIATKKLDHFLDANKKAVVEQLIIQQDDSYFLFGKYIITKDKKTKQYVVTKHSGITKSFYMLKSATSWCVADNNSKYQLSRSIENLDRQQRILSGDLEVEKAMLYRVQDPLKAEIISAKVTEKSASLSRVEFQLTKCTKLAKYWQTKGFICNETARPRIN